MTDQLPLSTLLSLAWVAFTIEADNTFEARMQHRTTAHGGVGPWLVSQAMWWNCMRFVDESGITVAELEARAHTATNLSGMLRWGYVSCSDPTPKRSSLLRARPGGNAAREVWTPLTADIEERWRTRLGADAFAALEDALGGIVGRLDPGLPDTLPILHYGLKMPPALAGPVEASALPLPALLARVIVSLTREFEAEAGLSLAIAANVLRVIGEAGVKSRELPILAGISKEALEMAVKFLEKRGFAEVQSQDRSRIVMLTASGQAAKVRCARLLADFEQRWRDRFGIAAIDQLRAALEPATTQTALAEAIAPSPGGWRAKLKPPRPLPWQPMVLHRGGYPDGA